MEHGTFRLHTLNQDYSQAVISAGGVPVMLPSNNPDIDSLLDRLDAVIITGGGDIDPKEFGQDHHDKTGDIDPERDAFELAIVHAAIRRDMPLLGICRGLQILNVALGGTLQQDIADLVPNAHQHRQQDEKIGQSEASQTAVITDGSHPIPTLAHGKHLQINSFHHQCIGVVAPSLRVMARTEDDVVEAVYNPDMTFGVAVQWHPELLAQQHAEHAAIFRAFVGAASVYQQRVNTREVSELV